jgi:hypothetical protein
VSGRNGHDTEAEVEVEETTSVLTETVRFSVPRWLPFAALAGGIGLLLMGAAAFGELLR